ncbi:MAG: acetamidase/formamidase family protein [Oscillospiraceae bacterium]|nr:acetamidase/formamidase family protein [Oscillospiraceae bacterium]
MQLITRDTAIYNCQSKENTPATKVKSGEVFCVETQLCGGGWLKSEQDRWSPAITKGPNYCNVIEVEGAKPGQLLEVTILSVETEELGYTGFAGWRNDLAQMIIPNDWDIVTKTVTIKDGFVNWSDQLKLPVIPMVGVVATAPEGEAITNAIATRHGGNMDLQEVCPGTTITLPVEVAGALLHIGDCHAIMGDGEICRAGGIECQAKVTLKVELRDRPEHFDWIWLDNEEYLMTAACETDVKQSFASAAYLLIQRMVKEYGFSEKEAYLLLGQVLESRCSVYVSPMYTVVCKINRKYLKPDPNFQ